MMLDHGIQDEICGAVRKAIQQEMSLAGNRLRHDIGKLLEQHKDREASATPLISQRKRRNFQDGPSEDMGELMANMLVPFKRPVSNDEEMVARASHISFTSEASVGTERSLRPSVDTINLEDMESSCPRNTGCCNPVMPGDLPKEAVLFESYSRTSSASGASGPSSCRYPLLQVFWCYVSKVVTCASFEYAICCILAMDAVSLGAETAYESPAIFRILSLVFCMCYVLELCMRIIAHGRLYLAIGWGWKWNVFDTTIIALQFINECLVASAGPRAFARVSSNVNVLRMWRFVRLLRFMRVFHVFYSFQQLRSMVDCITASLKSMSAAIIPIAFLVYAFGVYITAFVIDLAQERPDLIEDGQLAEYFGSLPKSLMSLFQAVTGGIDWSDLFKPLMKVSPYLGFVLVLYVAIMVIAVLNVVTGFFVDSAMLAVARAKDVELRDQMRAMFQKSMRGSRSSQTLSWTEFRDQLDDPQMTRCLHMLNIDPSEAKGLFTLLDTDSSGEINAEEFVMGAIRLKGNAKAIDLATLMYFNKRMAIWWHGQKGTVTDLLRQMRDMMHDSRAAESTAKGAVRKTARGASKLFQRESSASLASFATWADVKGDSKGI